MIFKKKNRKIILIVAFSIILLLLLGVGIYLLTRSKEKNSENKKEQKPFKERGDEIEFMVEFKGEEEAKWYVFIKWSTTEDRLICVDKNHSAFSQSKPNSGSFYYLKIQKNQKGKTFFEKSDFVELSRK